METDNIGGGRHTVRFGHVHAARRAIANDRTCRGRLPTAHGHTLRRS